MRLPFSDTPTPRASARLSRPCDIPFDTNVLESDVQVILAVSGEIDCFTVDRFRDALQEAVKLDRRVVVDLRRTTFMGVEGVRALGEAAQQLGVEDLPLVVRSANTMISWLLSVAGVDRLLTISALGTDPCSRM